MDDLTTLSYEIAEAVEKGEDIAFLRRMQNTIIQLRATILKQQYDRDGRFPSGSEDTINIRLIRVPKDECLSDDIECEVTRTEYKIPRPISRNRTAVPFIYVGTINFDISFIYVRPEEVRSILQGTRFINTSKMYAYFNDYIYTFNNPGSRITIRDIFGDPRELLTLIDCDKKPCKTSIELNESMKRQIKVMAFEEIRMFNKLPETQNIKLNENE